MNNPKKVMEHLMYTRSSCGTYSIMRSIYLLKKIINFILCNSYFSFQITLVSNKNYWDMRISIFLNHFKPVVDTLQSDDPHL